LGLTVIDGKCAVRRRERELEDFEFGHGLALALWVPGGLLQRLPAY
jgi:hypothetical protein